ncbi:phosphatidylserine/phosphatidylglycerophosphate/cardiolipin synthase family protein [Arcanobacterium haemolyticum]|nr:phosphatidylserine/phosphatidylglycerophosphate/cardiolipin synthase family protein [Arcanobacterium haemolyticum]
MSSSRKLMKAIRIGTLSLLAAQATAIAAVSGIDAMRKRRTPPTGRFPHLPPQEAKVGRNTTTLYTYGRELYDAMLDDIRNAHDHIYFECFIVKADDTGMEFRDALIEAARRGVETYVILDTWGNFNQDPRFRHFPQMEHLHAFNFPFVRTGILTGRSRDKGRDHRKILTVDGKIGYVGGYNIGTLYAHQWRDTHMRIEGPGAWELESSFIHMWNSYRKQDHPELPDSGIHNWDSHVSAVENTPARNIYPISSLYMSMLSRASKRAWITMGYFIPDEPMLESLTRAARRGVDVRILIPEYSNHVYSDWAGRGYYEDLLRAGVHIWLYQEAMVHAKTMTIDGRWSTVGTANIDRLSLRGNFEINMEIFDKDFAAQMEEIFNVDLTNSRELTLDEWRSRSALARIGERLIGMLAPLF